MSEIKITEVLALPDDVLQVTGTVGEETVTAFGWQSALANHYDESSVDKDGHRKDDAKPREMSKAEKRDYCRSLLEAAVESQPRALSIED